MISQSYTQTASGFIIPRSNGYANRLILDQLSSGTKTLPSWAKVAKVALLGAAGSGAALSVGTASAFPRLTAGSGGPLVLATLNLDEVGRSFNYVLGAGGASVLITTNGAGLNGNAGALSSVVWGSRTLTANPGLGGVYSDTALTALAGPLGGAGTGGDLNHKGGDGGGYPARAITNYTAVPGGGSSGRPYGDGLRGGQFVGTLGATGLQASYGLSGSSWGATGDIDPRALGSTTVTGGPGTLGPSFDYLPGRGAGSLQTSFTSSSGGSGTTYNQPGFMHTPSNEWWDLDDISGWGGGYIPIGQSGTTLPIAAGPGGGGSGIDLGNVISGWAGVPHKNGGFGGGGGASGTGQYAYAGDGGRGAGGGAAVQQYASNGSSYVARSGKGGDAWLGIWFN